VAHSSSIRSAAFQPAGHQVQTPDEAQRNQHESEGSEGQDPCTERRILVIGDHLPAGVCRPPEMLLQDIRVDILDHVLFIGKYHPRNGVEHRCGDDRRVVRLAVRVHDDGGRKVGQIRTPIDRGDPQPHTGILGKVHAPEPQRELNTEQRRRR
jgi:hypothetical protein